jgi:hypothetical protein
MLSATYAALGNFISVNKLESFRQSPRSVVGILKLPKQLIIGNAAANALISR